MKFEFTLKYFDEDGQEMTSSTDVIYADDEKQAHAKAEELFVKSTADDYSLEKTF